MEPFLSKHAHAVIGTLSGFDRLVFRGTLRFLAHCAGMSSYLGKRGKSVGSRSFSACPGSMEYDSLRMCRRHRPSPI
jgi:hypothetical protein